MFLNLDTATVYDKGICVQVEHGPGDGDPGRCVGLNYLP